MLPPQEAKWQRCPLSGGAITIFSSGLGKSPKTQEFPSLPMAVIITGIPICASKRNRRLFSDLLLINVRSLSEVQTSKGLRNESHAKIDLCRSAAFLFNTPGHHTAE